MPALLDDGHELTSLRRPGSPGLDDDRQRVVRGDLLRPASYRDALRVVDTVLHMAAVTHTNDVGEYYRVNRDGTAMLLEEAERAGVGRFVLVSSRAAEPAGGAYSDSKARAEEIVRSSALEWLILRPAEVYGTGTGMIDRLIAAVDRWPVVLVPGDGSHRVAPIHVEDVVEAVRRLVSRDPPVLGTFTLAGPEALTLDECLDRIQRARGVRRARLHVPVPVLRLVASAVAALRVPRPPLVKDQIPRLLVPKDSDITALRDAVGSQPRRIERFLERA